MGNMNQFNYVKAHINYVRETILEVGSKDYGSTPDFRSLFPGFEYVGVDMESGKGVDVVLDLTEDFEIVAEKLGFKKFSTVICFSVLEHCINPFKMCDNITRLLTDTGVVFISVPFVWEIHAFPSDYWRFTPEGVKALFPDLEFDMEEGDMSTSIIGQTAPIDDFTFGVSLSIPEGLRRKVYGYPSAVVIKLCRMLKIFPWLFSYTLLFPPVLINMIGKKRWQ